MSNTKEGKGLISGKEPTYQCSKQETWVWSLGLEDPLEESVATHCSILAWVIPWTEEPGGLQSMGLQGEGHDWSDLAYIHQIRGKRDEEEKKEMNKGLMSFTDTELFQINKKDAKISGEEWAKTMTKNIPK